MSHQLSTAMMAAAATAAIYAAIHLPTLLI